MAKNPIISGIAMAVLIGIILFLLGIIPGVELVWV